MITYPAFLFTTGNVSVPHFPVSKPTPPLKTQPESNLYWLSEQKIITLYLIVFIYIPFLFLFAKLENRINIWLKNLP